MPITVRWAKCEGGVWCTLSRVNLDTLKAEGVYIIWKPADQPYAVRVGQGDIAIRLEEHRNDPDIMQHGNDLRVTWAAVAPEFLDQVERYLAEQLSPAVGDRFPDAPPLVVNLPGQ